jgi:hypothetical protein
VSPGHLKQPPSKFQIALVALIPLFWATSARADVYSITIINATFDATCIGGSGTCSEVVNGSLLFDSVTQVGSDISMSLTGTLFASLDSSWNSASLFTCPVCFLPPYLFFTIQAY